VGEEAADDRTAPSTFIQSSVPRSPAGLFHTWNRCAGQCGRAGCDRPGHRRDDGHLADLEALSERCHEKGPAAASGTRATRASHEGEEAAVGFGGQPDHGLAAHDNVESVGAEG
jgi:hypothetical protein